MKSNLASRIEVLGSARRLLDYCRAENWSGYDPYDALNSKMINVSTFQSRIPRIIFTQFLKRSPINFRKVLQIPKTQNPKGIALFLSAILKAPELSSDDSEELTGSLIERLVTLRSPDSKFWSWGYSFPWQTRSVVVPSGAANLVCTTFVAQALLDCYERRNDVRGLEMAASAAEYILNELYWTDGTVAGFSYPLPSVRSQVHNSNFLAAALLCRVFRHTGEHRFLEPAFRVARYSAAKQRPDGSWPYGEAKSQQWIDNFHSGYNLCALRAMSRDARTNEFDSRIRDGYQFYRDNFFLSDSVVRYFHNRTYPLDIHCIAQSILTLVAFKDIDSSAIDAAHSVFGWAMEHMWDDRGFFYYRALRLGTIRTSYMRWSQAWMLLAMSNLLNESKPPVPDEHPQSAGACV